jgi:hypothetical protein
MASSTLRVSGPMCANSAKALCGATGMAPKVGLKPTRPQYEAGMRTEPPASLPNARGPQPAATCAAAPQLDPPGERVVSSGWRVVPACGLVEPICQPNSVVVVLPKSTQPAARNGATQGASCDTGASPAETSEPRRVGQPATFIRSLIDTGTPSSALSGRPVRQRSPAACAWARAPSASIRQNALMARLSAAMAASKASSTASGVCMPSR